MVSQAQLEDRITTILENENEYQTIQRFLEGVNDDLLQAFIKFDTPKALLCFCYKHLRNLNPSNPPSNHDTSRFNDALKVAPINIVVGRSFGMFFRAFHKCIANLPPDNWIKQPHLTPFVTADVQMQNIISSVFYSQYPETFEIEDVLVNQSDDLRNAFVQFGSIILLFRFCYVHYRDLNPGSLDHIQEEQIFNSALNYYQFDGTQIHIAWEHFEVFCRAFYNCVQAPNFETDLWVAKPLLTSLQSDQPPERFSIEEATPLLQPNFKEYLNNVFQGRKAGIKFLKRLVKDVYLTNEINLNYAVKLSLANFCGHEENDWQHAYVNEICEAIKLYAHKSEDQSWALPHCRIWCKRLPSRIRYYCGGCCRRPTETTTSVGDLSISRTYDGTALPDEEKTSL